MSDTLDRLREMVSRDKRAIYDVGDWWNVADAAIEEMKQQARARALLEQEIERLQADRQMTVDGFKTIVATQADEIERLRELISATAAGMASPMFDLWTAVREPEKSSMSIDHALGHLAQSLAPLRQEALDHDPLDR